MVLIGGAFSDRTTLGIAILAALHQPAASSVPATLAIAGRSAARPVGLAWIAGRKLPALAETFRTWLINSTPRGGRSPLLSNGALP